MYDYLQIKESWGFKNFKLFLYLCPPGCLVCIQSDSEFDCKSWVLTHTAYTEIDYTLFITDGWTISYGDVNKQQCFMIPTICGNGVCGKDTVVSLNLINIPTHSQMKIKLKYLKIDSWEVSDYFQLKVDGELKLDQQLSLFDQYLYGICGSTQKDVFINIEITFPHSISSARIKILNTLDQGFSDESFGIRDIQIFIKQSVCGDQVVELQEECDDGNLFPFDGCFNCMFSCVDGCSECRDMICLSCYEGWIYLEYEQICEKEIIQEYSIITILEIQTQFDCFPPIDNCQVCLLGKCILCQNDFFLNQFNSKCEQICFDQINSYYELCDEYQLQPFCNRCQIKCNDHCLNCNQGICQLCENDFILENNYCIKIEKVNLCQPQCQCQNICGNQIALYTLEECVCDLYCEKCQDGICYQCNNYFKLLNNQCISTCGDLIVQENEDCDDGNNIEFDGCFYCQYSCPIECIKCEQGICQDKCLPGFYLINNICSTICGDSIIAGNEQCEDNNIQEFDGCYLCQFQCPLNCEECINGICFNCNFGFKLIENKCNNVCGDGIMSNQEQCDDGNQESGDGCSQTCQVEIDWICNQGYDCTFVKYPNLKCEYMMQKNQYQYAQIKFSQAVQLLSDINYQDTIELSIIDLNQTLYAITIKEIQSAQYQVTTDVEYIVQIEIFTNLPNHPILEVKLTEQLFSANLAPLVNMVDYLQLNQPNYTTDQQIYIAQTVQMISKISVKSIYAISIILILLGNILSFWGILDALQQQSYLKFINVLYPQTLIIYFQSSELISVQSLLNSITDLNKKAKLLQFPYLESYEKFQYYEINADITEGFRTEILVSLTLLLGYICSILLERVISILELSSSLQGFPKFIRFLQRQQRKLNLYIRKIDISFIKTTLLACSWDLIFMSLLELYSDHDFSYYRSYVRLSITFVILIIIITLILSQISGVTPLKKQDLNQFWLQKQPVFLLIKKISIISILVFYQREQILQTLLMTFVNTFYLIYIINMKSTEEFQFYIKNIIMETSLTLFTASTFLNWDILQRYLSYNFIITISWIQMFLLVSVLISFLIFELYNLFYLIKRKINKLIEKRMSKIKSNEQKQSHKTNNQIQKANLEFQQTIFQRVTFLKDKQIQIQK
ncbi:unnamed protein product [Paramecium primaurelia]|uniref:Uncharacterized protein n=1 Tax=Paramecium primaurelia TaxID=5886 RepID=A0A8S1PKG8_PARPR|nr:unnamed protein product [Paramecium primaurelia]